jgi:hypothetical protein
VYQCGLKVLQTLRQDERPTLGNNGCGHFSDPGINALHVRLTVFSS